MEKASPTTHRPRRPSSPGSDRGRGGALLLLLWLLPAAGADVLRIASPTGEVSLEWAIHQGAPWVELEGLARALGVTSTWDPLTRRQEYLYPGRGPVVFIAGSRQARLGETLSLLPEPARRERAQFWVPRKWALDALFGHWGLTPLETPPETEVPPIERPDRISELIAQARAGQEAVSVETGGLVVMLDAGHGGEDTGSVSLSNLKEADITLSYALTTARALRQREPGVGVLFSRQGGQTLNDDDRAAAANRAGADLLISLHCGARRTSLPGAWIFYMSDLVDSPRALDLAGDAPMLSPWHLGYLPHQERSRKLAERIAGLLTSPGRPEPRIMPARLRLLRAAAMPGVLIELGNLGDESDAVRLSADSERESVAQALATAALQFLREPS